MLDIALLMANSSQLKTVLYVGPNYRFYVPLIALLSLSITLQVLVGLLLVFIGKSPTIFASYLHIPLIWESVSLGGAKNQCRQEDIKQASAVSESSMLKTTLVH